MLRFKQVFSNCLLGFGLAAALFALPAGAQARMTVLYRFNGGPDGEAPAAALVKDKSGNLYGTTQAGGGTSCGGLGCGTVFKLTPEGVESVLYAFKGYSDGGVPNASLIIDKDGNLYGTTQGATSQGGTGAGRGTVFKIAPDGTETVLHGFRYGSDGRNPSAPLIADKRGNLYGTTMAGGNYNLGTLFEITNDGRELILWSFGGVGDGAVPMGGLLADKAGNFYGTTSEGGSGSYCQGGRQGCGTVYEFTPGVEEKILWSFGAKKNDAEFPVSGLVVDEEDNLYGATGGGGGRSLGTVFKLEPDGTEHVLYSFHGSDGEGPTGVIIGNDGYLYGTTEWDTVYHGGTVFKVSVHGRNFTSIYTFQNAYDGRFPYAGLLADGNRLYGTTFEGGNSCQFASCGVIFAITK